MPLGWRSGPVLPFFWSYCPSTWSATDCGTLWIPRNVEAFLGLPTNHDGQLLGGIARMRWILTLICAAYVVAVAETPASETVHAAMYCVVPDFTIAFTNNID